MLCVVRLCTSTPFASPVEVHLQQGDHLRSGHALLCRRNERRRRGRECCGGSGVCHLLGKWNGGAQQHCWPRACEWAVRWGRAVSRGRSVYLLLRRYGSGRTRPARVRHNHCGSANQMALADVGRQLRQLEHQIWVGLGGRLCPPSEVTSGLQQLLRCERLHLVPVGERAVRCADKRLVCSRGQGSGGVAEGGGGCWGQVERTCTAP